MHHTLMKSEHSVRSIGMSGYFRMVLIQMMCQKVIRIIDHAQKWLFKVITHDFKGDVILEARGVPKT